MPDTGAKTSPSHPALEILHGPTVSDEAIHISKSGKGKITWYCSYDPNWKVDFASNTPFVNDAGADDGVFIAKHDTTGPIKGAALGSYKYTVTTVDGSEDPGVIIDP